MDVITYLCYAQIEINPSYLGEVGALTMGLPESYTGPSTWNDTIDHDARWQGIAWG